MKRKIYLFTTLLVGILFVSCENEVKDSNLPAKLGIFIQGSNDLETRSHSPLPTGTGIDTDSEGTINRLTVGVFKEDNSVDVISEITVLPADHKVNINATVGTRTIIVVANAPANYFTGISTKSAFIDNLADLKITTSGDLDTSTPQVSSELPMTGQATITEGGSDINISLSQATTAEAFVTLTRLVARVSVSKVKYAFEAAGAYPNAKFIPTHIFLYNAKTKSNWTFGSTTPTTTVLGQGELSTSANSDYRAYLGETVDDFTNDLIFTNPYYFYTFANYETSFPTKLVIKGTFDVDGNLAGTTDQSTVYYPIIINKAQAGTDLSTNASGNSTIEKNKTYSLNVTIKGKGVDSPGDDISPADVNLTVSVAPWALDITQDVTIE